MAVTAAIAAAAAAKAATAATDALAATIAGAVTAHPSRRIHVCAPQNRM